jgi:hypothetical protein
MVIMAFLYCSPYASLATSNTSKGYFHTVPFQDVLKKHQDASRRFQDGSRRILYGSKTSPVANKRYVCFFGNLLSSEFFFFVSKHVLEINDPTPNSSALCSKHIRFLMPNICWKLMTPPQIPALCVQNIYDSLYQTYDGN